MDRLFTHRNATMTEMRESHKVLERAGGRPVPIMMIPCCVDAHS